MNAPATFVAVTGNTYPVKDALKALGARWNASDKVWMVPAAIHAQAQAIVPAPVAPPAKKLIGDLTGIMAIFDKYATSGNKKKPVIVLSNPTDGTAFRISIAGPKSKEPGSLSILSNSKNAEGERDWLGRISKDGTFSPSHKATRNLFIRLKMFALDPAGVAAEHGQVTKTCCFCNTPITTAESLKMGYGPVCADNFGLPWG